MNTYADQFLESPLVNSYDTKPRRHSNISEPSSLFHSPSSSDGSSSFKPYKEDSEKGQKKKHGKKNNSFACRIREHVKLGPKLSETVKGKLQLGAKIIQGGGRENIFRQVFGIREGEQMLKASQCYLYTTAGPIAGLLFISTEKVAFCSERSITVPSPTGQFIRTPYKPSRVPPCAAQPHRHHRRLPLTPATKPATIDGTHAQLPLSPAVTQPKWVRPDSLHLRSRTRPPNLTATTGDSPSRWRPNQPSPISPTRSSLSPTVTQP